MKLWNNDLLVSRPWPTMFLSIAQKLPIMLLIIFIFVMPL